MKNASDPQFDTVIVGGGQAGLALGYWLAKGHHNFVILDENARTGDSWRQRWDSLRLFTPAKYDGLPGAPFPGDRLAFPHKDELADYLEEYARRFSLPVVHGVRVDGVTQQGDRFLVSSGDRSWTANNVVVATGGYRLPKRPAFANELDPGIVQLHSQEYKNPGQLQPGPVLVVGLGNSGAEIALEASRTHTTLLAGKASGEIPVRHGRAAARFVLPVIRFAGLHILTLNTPVGRKVAPAFKMMAAPLIRTRTKELRDAKVELLPRIASVKQGKPLLEEGRTLDVANVIWCTGYRVDYSWLKLPYQDGDGTPAHKRGVVESVSGLYFLGQEFLFAAVSATLPGVGRDARYLARRITADRQLTAERRPALT
ncbi:NAD(P)-binding domain-containing protein [Arthrobacter sp. NtRootA1]|uniref:flavin-containing monooxygenase n=1 Tax=Arthrobacter sp. NtRootA1 TaxID=2830983 RepID=UPI001CC7C030|nr:NAD(P)-binding domain-containing protein [Arthrobacter sp. NtRootA1]BCW07417.1 oxidoreductase [Arthrobacter sp. NtRootA1]